MAVTFNQIPSDIRVPGIYVEVNAGRPPFTFNNRLLLVGQKLTAGTATAGQLIRLDDGGALGHFGNGSMLADMAHNARAQAPLQEIWCLPLADPAGGVAATATITCTTTKFPLGRAAMLDIYVAGVRYRVPVKATDDEVAVGAAIAAAINAGYWRGNKRILAPVTAAVGTTGSEHIVTLTSRHKGITQNSLDVSVCHAEDDDRTALDALVIVNFASGAGTVDLAAAFAALGDEPFDTIVAPYADTQALSDVSAFLEARWGYISKIYGHYFTAVYDTYGNLGTFGAARNSPWVSIFGSKKLAHPTWSLVAAAGGDIALQLGGANRNRPLVGVVLNGIRAKARKDGFTIAERDSLLRDGISPLEIRTDRQVMLERVITTYQTTDDGIEDTTWLDVQTRYLVTYAVRYISNLLTARYSRRTFDEDQDATVEAMRADIINAYRELQIRGVTDNIAGFRARLRVERDPDDVTRVNVYLPFDVQNQLFVTAVNATAFLRFGF
jgi:phage tail sheath gpL-like